MVKKVVVCVMLALARDVRRVWTDTQAGFARLTVQETSISS
jgi:hypothetical protein